MSKTYPSKYILIVSIIVSVLNISYSIPRFDWPTGDEHWHYSYSERYYTTGETSRDQVHNYASTTPNTVLNVLSVRTYNKISGLSGFHKTAARLPQLAWYLILLTGMYSLGYLIANKNVAYWATLLFSLDPNLNAHAALIGTDLPFAAISVWVFYALFNFIKNPSLYKAIILGLTYGIAFCAKYSAIFLALPIFIGFIYITFIPLKTITIRRFLKSCSYALSLVLFLSIVINYAYSYAGFCLPISSRDWQSDIFKTIRAAYPNLPMLLPLPFLAGFDLQHAVERTWPWNVIILGKLFPSGVWYYFILTWLLKTPLIIIATVFVSLFTALINFKKFVQIKIEWLVLSITFICLFSYFSFIFRTQVGMRYCFPCLPISYLLIAGIINRTVSIKFQKFLAIIILFLSILELIPYRGNYLAFTNSLILDKKLAYKYLADSNIDWWQRHAAAKQALDSEYSNYHFEPQHIQPGINVFKLNTVNGVFIDFEQHAWLRANLIPKKHYEHAFLLYEISTSDFLKFISSQRAYTPIVKEQIFCQQKVEGYDLQNINSDILEIPVDQSSEITNICLKTEQDLLIKITPLTGKAEIGKYTGSGICSGLTTTRPDGLWFQLNRGEHLLCSRAYGAKGIELLVKKSLSESS